ncbi:trichodiene oxygenase [Aspergillus udagawae]|uniref:Trichodiene oxygenase n=1 Tax=Aspergillus udagawae TaxID=91492 RepID=A0A8H3P573_9EURO|nr:trichodiene oxygenase [Aspergillus udagawae]
MGLKLLVITDAYFDVYHSRDTCKDPEFYDAFFVPGGTLATLDHAEARKHRKPMLQMFSRKATLNYGEIFITQVSDFHSRSGKSFR